MVKYAKMFDKCFWHIVSLKLVIGRAQTGIKKGKDKFEQPAAYVFSIIVFRQKNIILISYYHCRL